MNGHAAIRLASARTRFVAATAFGAVAALTVIFVQPSPSHASSAKQHSVVSSAGSGLGRILVDRRGRTLYLFEKDTKGTSTCTGACASYWPPLLTIGRPRAGAGVQSTLLGTTRRADGTLQVTYNRHPLYTFKLDAKAGQTKGQNAHVFGADWYVVSPAGVSIDRSSGSTAGGYGY